MTDHEIADGTGTNTGELMTRLTAEVVSPPKFKKGGLLEGIVERLEKSTGSNRETTTARALLTLATVVEALSDGHQVMIVPRDGSAPLEILNIPVSPDLLFNKFQIAPNS